MESRHVKRCQENIIKIVCSLKLKLYIGITESGHLMLYRYPLTLIWIDSTNNHKFYDCCWHPNSEVIAAFYSKENIYYYKLIIVETGQEIVTKIFNKISWCGWFEISEDFMNKYQRFGNSLDHIIEKNDPLQKSNSLFNPILFARPNLLCICAETKVSIFLQALIPIFIIHTSSICAMISTNFSTIVLIDNFINIYQIVIKNKIHDLIDVHNILKYIYTFKLIIPQISESMAYINSNYYEKLVPLVMLFKKLSFDKSISRELCQTFYFGRISPELSHLLAEKSTSIIINNALISVTTMSQVWNYIDKIQNLTENLLSLCHSIKNCMKSSEKLENIIEYDRLEYEVEKLHSWSFRVSTIFHERNLIDSWRIFTQWLSYLKNFVFKDPSHSKFFSLPPFDSCSDIGSDSFIRKILINFILYKIENYINNCPDEFKLETLSLDPLPGYLEDFENCFFNYFSHELFMELLCEPCIFPKFEFSLTRYPSKLLCTLVGYDRINTIFIKIKSVGSKWSIQYFKAKSNDRYKCVKSFFLKNSNILYFFKNIYDSSSMYCQFIPLKWKELGSKANFFIDLHEHRNNLIDIPYPLLSFESLIPTNSLIASTNTNELIVLEMKTETPLK
ncbi:hypothetical protein HZS_558 [Henneguya salminicola]|nr:hypothetical protein HZS_558 [Henneguya salminicola]